jgi:hypothetical protein
MCAIGQHAFPAATACRFFRQELASGGGATLCRRAGSKSSVVLMGAVLPDFRVEGR